MFDERPGPVMQERPPLVESPLPEYSRCVRTLNKIGLVSILPRSEQLGAVGVDGKEYPIPTPEQIQELFQRNKELIAEKAAQGFTRLQLTPFAAPIAQLTERAKAAILQHEAEGRIFQAKVNPTDSNTPIQVDRTAPVWIWDALRSGDETGALVYFPKEFTKTPHGMTKQDLVNQGSICAVPGWSIGLIEDTGVLPQEGQGKTLAGRKQLETNKTPNQYLQMLQSSSYHDESGFTLEDFLVNFLTRLKETNRVSHDWSDNSGLWLPGTFLPQEGGVPYGYWNRGRRQLYLFRYYPGFRYQDWGAVSTVRLSL